ncbi:MULTISPECIES: hypothetical protein [Paraburkholderia]|uniref:hypothetical protein n=1 Tax=Paraburkholderia TaxID=1822464 RepID=UPI00035E452A|nr:MULTISPECIES: hypothetical protein [Paraburkholderia]MDH6149439.1 hypothetical protein [Paraburkholderia sp. WSM4179]
MNSTKKTETHDLLADALAAELLDMSDEDVLDGADAASAKAHGLRLLQAAKAEAGRRRLAAARQGAANSRSRTGPTTAGVSVESAKAYILQAMNDGRYTLAARKLEEMTDEDLLGLYSRIRRLDLPDGSGGSSDK